MSRSPELGKFEAGRALNIFSDDRKIRFAPFKETDMSLYALRSKREEEKRPIRIGMIVAGRYGPCSWPSQIYTRHAGGWSGGSEIGKSALRPY